MHVKFAGIGVFAGVAARGYVEGLADGLILGGKVRGAPGGMYSSGVISASDSLFFRLK
jgi:hypothetical protein